MTEIPHSKPFIGKPERDYSLKTLGSPIITGGIYTAQFESGIRNYLNSEYFFYTSSGTEALYLILKSLEVKKGDEVILPSYVCEGVYYAVVNSGATPVLADINDSWVVSYEETKKRVTNKTKAIIVVYTFGIECEIEKITGLGIPVVEDICQSFGLMIKNKKAGTFGVAAFASFKAIKCLTTGGEGGGIITNDAAIAGRLSEMKENYTSSSVITEFQAAFGVAQLEQYNGFLEKRNSFAQQYRDLLTPFSTVRSTSFGLGMNYRFVITTSLNVTATMDFFKDQGIHLRRGVDSLLHQHFSIAGNFPGTERMFHSTLSFPIYPALTQEEFSTIADVCHLIFK